jgi:hypothetical protein
MGKQLTPEQKGEAAKEELRTLIRGAHEAAQLLDDRKKAMEESILAAAELLRTIAENEMRTRVINYAEDASGRIRKWSERMVNAISAQLQAQCESWDEQIRERYSLVPRPLVIDMRPGKFGLYDEDSPEAAQVLGEAQFAVVIDGAGQ